MVPTKKALQRSKFAWFLTGPGVGRAQMLKNNPATFQNHPNWQQETVPRTENQALEADQEGTARSYAFNS